MNIVLGVGGGIAAYTSAELARLLMQQGHQVQVVMTAGGQEFVRPLTFAALTGHKVIGELFSSGRLRQESRPEPESALAAPFVRRHRLQRSGRRQPTARPGAGISR